MYVMLSLNYRPLPDKVTIRLSPIEGLGLFATDNIPKGVNLGICHIKDERYPDGLIRTPLGGFINHVSKKPNTERVDMGNHFVLMVIRDIKKDEEVTLTYSLYDPAPREGDDRICVLA